MTADSSPLTVQQTTSSAESNFRELDDAYLQTQARIWLGEILQIRFDEQVDISDLLADGELLSEVSEAISRMLPTLAVDESQLKVHEWKTLVSNKSTRRYMHYYNVDSFLRMCKNLGMDGIDLFTPSDVVERRSTRKVCMCLRSLSKLSRLRDLNVPDFDSVTCTLAMPTDMVECIRKSLEKSQSSSSLSVEQEVEKASRIRYWQRKSNSASAVSNGYSDNCDEAESRYVVAESYGSSDFSYDTESPNISGSQVVGDHSSGPQLSMGSGFNDEDDDQCEYLSPSKAESVGSPCSQYYSDEELHIASSDCPGSRISGKFPELNNDIRNNNFINDASHLPVPIDWGNSHLEVGSCKDTISSNANGDEAGCVSRNKDVDVDVIFSHDNPPRNVVCNDYLASSNNPSVVDSHSSSDLAGHPECVVFNNFHAVESLKLSHEDAPSNNSEAKHEMLVCEVGPNNGEPYSHEKINGKILSGEQITNSSSVPKPSGKPEFLCNNENQVSNNACTETIYVGQDTSCDSLNNGKTTSEDVGDKLRCREEQPPCSVDFDGCCNCSSLLASRSIGYDDYRGGTESQLLDMSHRDLNSSFEVVVAMNHIKCSSDCHDDATEVLEGHNDVVEIVNENFIDIVPTDNTIPVNSFTASDPQLEAQSSKVAEDIDHNQHQCVKDVNKGDSESVKEERVDKNLPLQKPQRKLLKSFVKGTALVGVAVFLLHLRKNRQDNLSKIKKRPAHIMIQGKPKPSQKGSNTSSVYPAEKLQLGI